MTNSERQSGARLSLQEKINLGLRVIKRRKQKWPKSKRQAQSSEAFREGTGRGFNKHFGEENNHE